jgi:NADH-quinone oxidoreductase subunit N
MTIAMLSLSGIPGTVGFIGKFVLIRALVDGNYTWLGIVLVIGSMLSLGYYLRVVGTMWMSPAPAPGPAPSGPPPAGPAPMPAIAGGSPELDSAAASRRDPELVFVAVVFGAASIFFGIFPSPLLHLAQHAGSAIGGIF